MTALSLFILPMGVVGPWQWVIIVLIILLLFGGKKSPELMRGVGKGVKEFKHGMKEAEKEINEIKSDIDKEEPKKVE